MADPIPFRAPSAPPEPAQGSDLAQYVGANLKRLRAERGLSLDRCAGTTGLTRAILARLEQGQGEVAIDIVWKIARAFDVPFSHLISRPDQTPTQVLRAAESNLLASATGALRSRPLQHFHASTGGPSRQIEFYELSLLGHSSEDADPHPHGTIEHLVVTSGALEIEIGDELHQLGTGDSILFQADQAHLYRNPAAEPALLYLVMTYPAPAG